MADSDDSYNFSEIKPFLDKLREGYDFVIGNRLKGKMEKKQCHLHIDILELQYYHF